MFDDNVAVLVYTMESSYNDIGLCDTSSITSDKLWLQLLSHCLKKHYIPGSETRSFIMTQICSPFDSIINEFDSILT